MTLIFSATSNFSYHWPTLLSTPKWAGKVSARDRCEYFLLDSAINDIETQNADIIATGIELNADAIVPKDYLRDWRSTVTSIHEFFDLESWEKDVLIPLQPPYEQSLSACETLGDWFGLGGLVGNPHKLQLMEYGLNLLEKAGKRCHLFGINPAGKGILDFIRVNKDRIYSLDTSKPEIAVMAGLVLDVTGKWVHFPGVKGDGLAGVKSQMCLLTLSVLDYITNHNGSLGVKTRAPASHRFGVKEKQKTVKKYQTFF
jgi:hypothetical protein